MVGRRLKNFCVGLTVTVLLLPVLAGVAYATDDFNLPTTIVTIEVFDGVESYFATQLSNVRSGYDVGNETYAGWCVDVRTPMARSPAKHDVMLYSSNSPPGELAAEKWDMVNYILNHKQGTREDVQQAIWYFVHMDGEYTPTRDLAWAIVNEALANGGGFVPEPGETAAIICFPTMLFPGEEVQISIIELTCPVIPELQPTALAMLLLTATATVILIRRKAPIHQH